MIDVVTLRASEQATRTGDIEFRYPGIMGLSGFPGSSASGELTFTNIAPSKYCLWKAAEIIGEFAHDACRVRFVRGAETVFLDETTMTFVVVTASDWLTQYTEPSLLANLDLWTYEELQIVVHLVRTNLDPDPTVVELRILMDFPTWQGSIYHCLRGIAEAVALVKPMLVISEQVTAPTSTWKIGEPYTEHGFVLSSLVQATVDGRHKSATLSNGVVTLLGPPATAGQTVEIAVLYQPAFSIRRGPGSRVVNKTPFWTADDLIVQGGLNGTPTKLTIAGYTIDLRRVELRVRVKGIAARIVDVLAMRAALQKAFSCGLTIDLPSCRQVSGYLDGFIEVIDNFEPVLPMASGIIALPVVEYVDANQFRNARDDEGDPIRTTLTMVLEDLTRTADFASIIECD